MTRWRRTGAAILWVVGLGGVVAGWMLGVPRLEAYAERNLPEQQIQIVFHNAPPWMQGQLRQRLEATARHQLSEHSLARGELVAVREALQQFGWFEQIHQVKRVSVSRIEIDAGFVLPYALIRDADGDHLVDPSGDLLPRSYPSGRASGFVVLLNPRYDRPTRPGEAWEGAEITAGLRLLRVIHEQPWRDQVVAIDLAGYHRDQQLTLITDRNTRIVWGSAPGDEMPGEALVEQKLHYLDHHHDRHGHIDRNHDDTVDITSPIAVIER